MHNIWRTAAVFCLLLLTAAGERNAFADSLTLASASVRASLSGAAPATANVSSPSDTSGLATRTLTGAGAAAGSSITSTAEVVDGVGHIGTSAVSTATSLQGGVGSAFGNASTGFYDTFLFSSTTLAVGTLVPVPVSFDPSYRFTTSGVVAGLDNAQAVFQVQLNIAYPDPSGFGTIGHLGDIFYSDSVGWGAGFPFSSTTAGVFALPIGQQIRISYGLFTSAGAFKGGSATVDALNTVTLFVGTGTDFTYSTSSGNTYLASATPVPEPSSLVLLLPACALALRRRSQRVRQRSL